MSSRNCITYWASFAAGCGRLRPDTRLLASGLSLFALDRRIAHLVAHQFEFECLQAQDGRRDDGVAFHPVLDRAFMALERATQMAHREAPGVVQELVA
ncbi:hypothetical protein [Paraburkholderia humisilvae]